eukprot:Skav223529  [mRNA]  locus=scaffold1160:376531:379024:- [translate_table: standard]
MLLLVTMSGPLEQPSLKEVLFKDIKVESVASWTAQLETSPEIQEDTMDAVDATEGPCRKASLGPTSCCHLLQQALQLQCLIQDANHSC